MPWLRSMGLNCSWWSKYDRNSAKYLLAEIRVFTLSSAGLGGALESLPTLTSSRQLSDHIVNFASSFVDRCLRITKGG